MSFGGNASKSNTKTNQTGQDTMSGTTNFTETPTNPDWVTSGAQDLYSNAKATAAVNPATYVAQPNDALTKAASMVGNLSGSPWNFDAAADLTRGVSNAKAPDISSLIGQFQSPYTGQVVDATAADLDHQAGLTRAQQALDLASSGAFGGSGAALTQAATEEGLARTRASTLAGLRQQGYQTALEGATAQAQLNQQQQAQRLASAAQLANLASGYDANQRANSAALDAAGTPIQEIQQNTAQSPLQLQSWLASLFSGSLPQLFQGQTGTQEQNSTENQVGNSTGNTSGFSFGLKTGK